MEKLTLTQQKHTCTNQKKCTTTENKQTSSYAMVVHWFTAAPKPLKIQVFWVIQPQGSHSPYILGDTTRPVTCVLVWSKLDRRRRLRKTLHKQTNRQTDRHYKNNGHLAVNQKLKPGLVDSYDIRPGNGDGLLSFWRFINLSLTHLLRHLGRGSMSK